MLAVALRALRRGSIGRTGRAARRVDGIESRHEFTRKTPVLGAGVIGLSCALELLKPDAT